MEGLQFLRKINERALQSAAKLKFDKKHPAHLYPVALYGSLIELSVSVIRAIENRERASVPILFRSFLEAYVDFENSCKDHYYGKYLEASYITEWIKVLEEAKRTDNPFLRGVSSINNFDNLLGEQHTKLKVLKDEGYVPLTWSEKFDRAGLLDVYRSVYNFVSCDTHNNIRALIDRHIEIKEGDFQVIYLKQSSAQDFLQYIDSLSGLLLGASVTIHSYLETGEDFNPLKDELQRIRAQYI